MQYQGVNPSEYGLDQHGFRNVNGYWNLGTAALIEHCIRRREGKLISGGALVVKTGHRMGRSPNDKFIVEEPSSRDKIWWDGKVNQPFDEKKFDRLYERLLSYLEGEDVFIQDCFAGADPDYRIPIRVITQHAWHNLFARQLFVRPDWTKTGKHRPQFTIIHVPHFHASSEQDGTNSEAFVLVHFGRGLIVIGGTSYAGEMKKSVFTLLNYLLPEEHNVLSMHCAANMGESGDVALFFGLSGTGKTSLSADPTRRLIGDDEHGWSNEGIFNFEGGCYAKVIRLSKEKEPQIYHALRFGAVLENVKIDPILRLPDYDDDGFTENTRAAYPVRFIDNAVVPGIAGHPRHILFLACDAYGILPPISKLNRAQTLYHFLSGYTALTAGVEVGLTEPQPTFSACFGAPFLALPPSRYAEMLGHKIDQHHVTCWLINTGWTGGNWRTSKRIDIDYTRAMVRAALSGQLAQAPYQEDPILGTLVPTSCPGVPNTMLIPRQTWKNPQEYDEEARKLVKRFQDNFEEKYGSGTVAPEIREAGPRLV